MHHSECSTRFTVYLSVPMENLQEVAYSKSNGHVADDDAWSRRSRSLLV